MADVEDLGQAGEDVLGHSPDQLHSPDLVPVGRLKELGPNAELLLQPPQVLLVFVACHVSRIAA